MTSHFCVNLEKLFFSPTFFILWEFYQHNIVTQYPIWMLIAGINTTTFFEQLLIKLLIFVQNIFTKMNYNE